jgi:hypothetical protein
VFFPPEGDPKTVAELIAQHLSEDRLYAFQTRVRMHFTWERIYRQKIQPLLKT